MPEFFELLPPDQARRTWLSQVSHRTATELIGAPDLLGRVTAQPIISPETLPAFARSAVDGYAVRAADTFGASDTLPAYIRMTGEILMGQAAPQPVHSGETMLIHTGGMIPPGADAVVMIEYTQVFAPGEIEIMRPVAPGENVIQVGEDILSGAPILPAGHRIRPQDIGALMAVGLVEGIPVAHRPRICLFSTGDELVEPGTRHLKPGQVRDINSGTIGTLAVRAGAEIQAQEIISDEPGRLYRALIEALPKSDMLVITAGSSVSVRDLTADAVNRLGKPGVLVHGLAIKPGKPTILAVVAGKPIIGLPGNPVSAFVVFSLLGVPAIAHLLGSRVPLHSAVRARAAANIPSVTGREDYIPVRLSDRDGELWAEPIFGKSNLIFTLVGANGLLKVPLNANGLPEGAWGEVVLLA